MYVCMYYCTVQYLCDGPTIPDQSFFQGATIQGEINQSLIPYHTIPSGGCGWVLWLVGIGWFWIWLDLVGFDQTLHQCDVM